MKERSLQILSKYCVDNDFDVIPEGPIIQIFYIYLYFIRE